MIKFRRPSLNYSESVTGKWLTNLWKMKIFSSLKLGNGKSVDKQNEKISIRIYFKNLIFL